MTLILFLWWLGIHMGVAQFAVEDECHDFSSLASSDCTVTCGSQLIDLSSIVVNGEQTRVFSWLYDYHYEFIIPVCGTEPFSASPSWVTSDVWQDETYYLGTYNPNSWMSGYYLGRYALSANYIAGQSCSPYTSSRSTTLYLVCNNAFSSTNPSISVTEPTICSYEIVLQYADLCEYSSVPVPTAAPTFRGSRISQSAQAEVIIAVVLIMFFVVGCYVSCRKWYLANNNRSVAVLPNDGTYSESHVVLYNNSRNNNCISSNINQDSAVEDIEMRPRISTNSGRERQRRLDQLYEQLQISAEQGYASNAVPTATPVTAVVSSVSSNAVAAIPIATVVTVNGVRMNQR